MTGNVRACLLDGGTLVIDGYHLLLERRSYLIVSRMVSGSARGRAGRPGGRGHLVTTAVPG